ncbi:hypothetical protein H0H81_003117 [Sphagnurus paluster]|uniref:beta-glucosidase n=1 Tax=Sphagnurus paluster TaxID=117069 RepID=A0A9P7GTZ3_9AGAR|nr:hypothetical protein H0H81_003117 [Sphagnurus paluster]
MLQNAVALGAEFRGKGAHVSLASMMNIQRAPAAGRNWEGFGGDPYLSGEAAFLSVQGIQSQGVQGKSRNARYISIPEPQLTGSYCIACAKHYINNEQEHYRETSSSNVDDR